MPITQPTKSVQYKDYDDNKKPVSSVDWDATVKYSYGKLTFTSAGFTTPAAGDIKLIRMPAGPVRILSMLSRIVCPQGSTGCKLDIGIGQYTDKGVPVALQGNALASGLAVGTSAINQALPLPATGYLEINSDNGFDIVCSFDTANSPASGDLHIGIAYQTAR